MVAKILKELNKVGIVSVSPLLSPELIDEINETVDPVINQQETDRKYVRSDELLEYGLLYKIFNEKIRNLIDELVDQPEIYHCHIYEISPNQSESHIHSENGRRGWHYDYDCPNSNFPTTAQFISIFIYLTSVSSTNGPFEITRMKRPKQYKLLKGRPCFSLIGPAGYSFVFDREVLHRASPNISSVPRRVLKLSIQSKIYKNQRILLDEYRNVAAKVGESDVWLSSLFGNTVDEKVYRESYKSSTFDINSIDALSENSIIDTSIIEELKGAIAFYMERLRGLN